MRAVFVLLLVACTKPAQPPARETPVTSPAADAHDDERDNAITQVAPPVDAAAARPIDAPALATTCPPTAAEAVGICKLTQATSRCEYAGMICECHGPCSGAEPPVPPPDRWHCAPPPPKVRADGCPGAGVQDGVRCSKAGLKCSYGSCCMTTFTCKGGVWRSGGTSCPP